MWQTKGLKVDVEFFKHVGVMFGIPKYSEALAEVAKSYNIKVTFKHSLLEVTTK